MSKQGMFCHVLVRTEPSAGLLLHVGNTGVIIIKFVLFKIFVLLFILIILIFFLERDKTLRNIFHERFSKSLSCSHMKSNHMLYKKDSSVLLYI